MASHHMSKSSKVTKLPQEIRSVSVPTANDLEGQAWNFNVSDSFVVWVRRQQNLWAFGKTRPCEHSHFCLVPLTPQAGDPRTHILTQVLCVSSPRAARFPASEPSQPSLCLSAWSGGSHTCHPGWPLAEQGPPGPVGPRTNVPLGAVPQFCGLLSKRPRHLF